MISVIIPAYNEEDHIAATIRHILNRNDEQLIQEIIVADGGSTDNTFKAAKAVGAKVIVSEKKGRAAQMNAGASIASGAILYFLHADSFPPAGFTVDIVNCISKGFKSGCYRLAFDHKHWFLQANCWFTRFNINAVRFGDQSLFVTKEVFQKVGGFNESLIVMEDQEIIKRIRKRCRFKVMPGSVTTSARKYLDNGIFRMQRIFFQIYLMYKLGYKQERLVVTYRALIRQNKV